MKDKEPKPDSPAAPTKGKTVERIERGMRSTAVGGDMYSRIRGNYSKNQPDQTTDPYDY